jgi:hypothetical protein
VFEAAAMTATRLERAERRLRAGEALVADLAQAVADERRLALYTGTGSARLGQARYERPVIVDPPPASAIAALFGHRDGSL